MNFQQGDLVAVDLLGRPFHGDRGVVTEAQGLEVWVALVEYSVLANANVLAPPMRFEPWELRLLKRPRDNTT